MPTYEYRCAACGQHIEIVQSFSDDPLTECGACTGPLRKVFSPVGIVFKGSGFYKTDSRSGSKRSGSEPKKDAPKEPAKSETKSDSGSGSGSSSGSGSTDAKIA